MFLVIQFGCIGPGHGELAALLSRHHARGLTGTRKIRVLTNS